MEKLKNTIFVVGMGPGSKDKMTGEAIDVLEKVDVVVGYTVYVDLLKPIFPNKEYLTTPMRQEIERCKLCFEIACKGKSVALVCSGDAGVYGMAAPMLEIGKEYSDIGVVIIPGITAANTGAALLGSPLNHDYCVISLSDLLTPWETIEKRLRAAIEGDFALAIYNPSSHKRADYLEKACDIMLNAGALQNRACGFVENIGREGERKEVCTLEELKTKKVNMFTTVFIGNSESEIFNDKLITKRGYHI